MCGISLNSGTPMFIFNEENAATTTFPFFPLWTLFLNAGHQGRINIRLQVIVNDRIVLAAPVRFHDIGSDIVVKEGGPNAKT